MLWRETRQHSKARVENHLIHYQEGDNVRSTHRHGTKCVLTGMKNDQRLSTLHNSGSNAGPHLANLIDCKTIRLFVY